MRSRSGSGPDPGPAQPRHVLAAVFRPVAGSLSDVVAATMARQRSRLTTGVAMTALAFAFATSTAILTAPSNGRYADIGRSGYCLRIVSVESLAQSTAVDTNNPITAALFSAFLKCPTKAHLM